MKAQPRKAFQNSMRSPSPDVAHRSIITNTKSPANEIKQFMRMRQSSTSPKSMTTSFHQINRSFTENDQLNRLKRHIQQLEARIKFLERVKISHQQLTIINQRLNGEVQALKLQLRDKEGRSQSNSSRNVSPRNLRGPSPRSKGVSLVRNTLAAQNNPQAPQAATTTITVTSTNPLPTDNILRQFNERIVKMSEENKRLGKKLKQISDMKQNLERQNTMLKGYDRPIGQYDIENLKRYFADESDRIVRYYQGLNESRLGQVNVRVNLLKDEVNRLTNRSTERKTPYVKTSSPLQQKGNQSVSMQTNFRSTLQQQGPSTLQGNRYWMAQSKYTTSPSEFKTLTLDTSPIRVLQEQREKIRRENDGLYRRTVELEGQLKRVLMENNRMQKAMKQLQKSSVDQRSRLDESGSSSYRKFQQKSEQLEHQLSNKETELRFKCMQMEQLEKRLSEISSFRQKENENHMKIIQQEKEKNNHYLNELQDLQKLINEKDRNTVSKSLYQQLETQLLDMKTKYQSLMTQYKDMKNNFDKYLQMVQEIRHSLTGQQVEDTLKQVELKWTGYDQLEMEIIKVHECHQAVVQEYKKNLLEKEQLIAQLQRDNLLLKEENQQNLILVKKLQKAIQDYSQPSKAKLSQQEMKRKLSGHQSAQKSGQPCLIRDYINRTDHKLSLLESQINSVISEQDKQRLKFTPSSKYQFNPVEVESVYRKSSYSNMRKQSYNDINRQGQVQLYEDDYQQGYEDQDDIPDEREVGYRQ